MTQTTPPSADERGTPLERSNLSIFFVFAIFQAKMIYISVFGPDIQGHKRRAQQKAILSFLFFKSRPDSTRRPTSINSIILLMTIFVTTIIIMIINIRGRAVGKRGGGGSPGGVSRALTPLCATTKVKKGLESLRADDVAQWSREGCAPLGFGSLMSRLNACLAMKRLIFATTRSKNNNRTDKKKTSGPISAFPLLPRLKRC